MGGFVGGSSGVRRKGGRRLASSGVFKPETGLVVVQVVGFGVLAAFAAAASFAAVVSGAVWVALIFAPIGLLFLTTAVRSLVMRVTFDGQSLHIVGLFGSRRIPRSAVLEVEGFDLEYPLVRWALPGETDRWSVLTPLTLGSSPFLPASMYRRRHRFLATLRRWAPDVADDHVRLGLWSRFSRGFAEVMFTVWESPALRGVAASLAAVVAVAAYWFGWVTLVGVVEGRLEDGRGHAAPLFLAGLAAEGAYWLLPLRRRRTRAWHIVLALLLAPLGLMLIATWFV